MLRVKTDFRCEQIPHRLIAKNTRVIQGTVNFPNKFQWIKEMLNTSANEKVSKSNTTISPSLVSSHRKLATISYHKNKENIDNSNINISNVVMNKAGREKMKTLNQCDLQRKSLSKVTKKRNRENSQNFSKEHSCEVLNMKINRNRRNYSREYIRRPMVEKREQIKLKFEKQFVFKLDPWVNEDEKVDDQLFNKYQC